MTLDKEKLIQIISEILEENLSESQLEERCQKGYKTHPTQKTKEMFGKTYRNCVKAEEGKEPAKGTGKKPKGSSRRLYTDENPKDTVSVKFSTVQDIRDTLSKASFKSKSHARQSQIINLIHQRVRAAHKNAKDPKVKARLKKALDYAENRKEASKEKTKRMNKKDESIQENILQKLGLAAALALTPSTAQATQSYNPLSKEMVQVLNNVDKQTFTAPTGITPDAIYLTKKYLKDFSDKKINKDQLMKLLQTIDKNKNNLEMPKEFKQ